jgi:hypothetical protein
MFTQEGDLGRVLISYVHVHINACTEIILSRDRVTTDEVSIGNGFIEHLQIVTTIHYSTY